MQSRPELWQLNVLRTAVDLRFVLDQMLNPTKFSSDVVLCIYTFQYTFHISSIVIIKYKTKQDLTGQYNSYNYKSAKVNFIVFKFTQ